MAFYNSGKYVRSGADRGAAPTVALANKSSECVQVMAHNRIVQSPVRIVQFEIDPVPVYP
jgi:hypothetical protein